MPFYVNKKRGKRWFGASDLNTKEDQDKAWKDLKRRNAINWESLDKPEIITSK